ncbi:MAG: haloacid dehalogenase type II [Pseudomonadota bacterium]
MAEDFSQVGALAFDHYGTLFNKQAVADLLEAEFPGKGAEAAALWFRTIKKYCWLSGMMERYLTWDDITQRALTFTGKSLGLEIADDLYERLIEADVLLPPYPEVPAALKRLAAKFDLYVLSMGSAWMIEASQKNAGVDQYFKGVISTEPLQLYKPGRPSYDVGVEAIARPKEEIGFVSSNSFDVIGGKNYGFPTFWVNRTGAPLDELGPRPDIVADNLDALADALGA